MAEDTQPNEWKIVPQEESADRLFAAELERWEGLPEGTGTEETCDVTPWPTFLGEPPDPDAIGGWSKTAEDRCGEKAYVICRQTCGCGACDMTIRHCVNCHAKYLHRKRREVDELAAHRKLYHLIQCGGMLQDWPKDQPLPPPPPPLDPETLAMIKAMEASEDPVAALEAMRASRFGRRPRGRRYARDRKKKPTVH